MKNILVVVCILLVACQSVLPTSTTISSGASATALSPAETSVPTDSPTPTLVPTLPAAVNELEGAELPPGFSLIKFADLPRPTAFAFDQSGRMYVSSQDGNIYVLLDPNQDGRADMKTLFASGFVFPLGVAVQESTGDVYVSHEGVISTLRDENGDGKADGATVFVGDLPFGKHQNDNLEFGPDGWLYIGVGSTCDACVDSNPLSAAILRFNVKTGERQVFATGLRNPFDLAFQPGTGELFATDNGRDDLGLDTPYEELNHIVQGGNYGYPQCWNAGDQPGCEKSLPAVAFFEAHSSADGVDFYNGQSFPPEYRGNGFVSIFGSWLKGGVQTGIQRVVLSLQGTRYVSQTSWFIRFPTGVMPLPVAFGPDDAMYVGDYINGVIYRLSYGMP